MPLTLILALAITLFIGLMCLKDWRYGIVLIIVVGVLQDVLRKLTPGVPAYFIAWSMFVFVMIFLLAVFRGGTTRVQDLWLADRNLRLSFILFFLLIVLQSIHAFLRWESPLVPVLGMVFYFAPLGALLLTIQFSKQEIWLHRFIRWYLVIMVPVCLSIYLSPVLESQLPVLRDVGSFQGNQLVIYDVGTVLYSFSGLLRVGEIASFHAAVCCGFLSILILDKREKPLRKVFFSVLIILLLGAIVMTGRRKMLMALVIFWGIQFCCLLLLGKRANKLIFAISGTLVAVLLGLSLMDGNQSSLYLERGITVFSSLSERSGATRYFITSAIERSDFFGLGAGVASQGIRFIGIDTTQVVGGVSESGLGLIAIELGIPGLLVISLLLVNLVRVLVSNIVDIARYNERLVLYAVSFAALLIANMVTFVAASQLYGDYFVLIILGVITGMLYSTIRHAMNRKALLILCADEEQQTSKIPGTV